MSKRLTDEELSRAMGREAVVTVYEEAVRARESEARLLAAMTEALQEIDAARAELRTAGDAGAYLPARVILAAIQRATLAATLARGHLSIAEGR